MMAFMFPGRVESENVERYMRALIRAQSDIDMEPERYKHYFIKEIPERFRDQVDVRFRRRRTCGPAALYSGNV
jgi:NitT/TauT family transport system substrate-binding protein